MSNTAVRIEIFWYAFENSLVIKLTTVSKSLIPIKNHVDVPYTEMQYIFILYNIPMNIIVNSILYFKLDVDPQRDDDASPMSTYRWDLLECWFKLFSTSQIQFQTFLKKKIGSHVVVLVKTFLFPGGRGCIKIPIFEGLLKVKTNSYY